MAIPLRANRFAIWILVLAGFAGIGGLQSASDSAGSGLKADIKKATIMSSEPLVPGTSALRVLSLGNPSVMADLTWIKTIQYFGSGNPYGKYPSLGPLLNTITELDPQYVYPYQFGMVVLPFMDQTPMAIQLGERAQTALPDNGLLTYFHATNYHLYVKDYAKAAEYYQKASKQEGAPTAATELAGITLSSLDKNSTDRIVAREFWRTVYQNATNEDDKQRAKDWFDHMNIVYNIETAAAEFKRVNGRYPTSQQELVDAKLLPQIYSSPIHRRLEFSTQTGRISFDKLIEE